MFKTHQSFALWLCIVSLSLWWLTAAVGMPTWPSSWLRRWLMPAALEMTDLHRDEAQRVF
jgi:hypothetical protein